MKDATLREILERLNKVYTGNIGYEYVHIEDKEGRMCLRDKIENRNMADDFGLSMETKKRILDKLNDATVFENFLHTKYIGQKRFSLEGGEKMSTAIAEMGHLVGEDTVEAVSI